MFRFVISKTTWLVIFAFTLLLVATVIFGTVLNPSTWKDMVGTGFGKGTDAFWGDFGGRIAKGFTGG